METGQACLNDLDAVAEDSLAHFLGEERAVYE
jgi:hypothetical protein